MFEASCCRPGKKNILPFVWRRDLEGEGCVVEGAVKILWRPVEVGSRSQTYDFRELPRSDQEHYRYMYNYKGY